MNAAQEKLAAAKRQIAESEAQGRAVQEAAATALRRRESQVDEARKELAELRTLLFSRLEQVPRSMNRSDTHSEGAGVLKFGNALAGPKQQINAKWDVVAWAPIEVTCKLPPYTWSASLIHGDLGDGNGYRWYEISFFKQLSARRRDVPFALNPNQPEFREAIGSLSRTARIVDFQQLAFPNLGETAHCIVRCAFALFPTLIVSARAMVPLRMVPQGAAVW